MDAISQSLINLLGIQKGEEKLALSFFAYSFLLGLSASLIDISAYSIFLSSFGADFLPYVYIGIGVLLTLGTFAYGWLSQRVRLERYLTAVIIFNLLSLSAIWLGLAFTSNTYLKMALPILQELVLFLDTMIFWEYCDRLFDIRQGKRLFGKIRSFQFLAVIVGGSGAALLAGPVGIENLLGIAVVITAIILVLGLNIKRNWPAKLSQPDEEETLADGPFESAQSILDVLKNRLALLIFAMTAVSVLEFYFLDNIFYTAAGERFPQDDDFAVFYGTFSAFSGLVCWIFLGLFTGPILSRFGLHTSLLIMPLVLLLAISATLVAGILFAPPSILFWMIVGTKMLDDVLTPAFNDSSVDVLYQVLPGSIRSRTRSFTEGIAFPLSAAFAGVILLLLTGTMSLGIQSLLSILVVIVLACIIVAWILPREYKSALTQALASRNLGNFSDLLGESSGTEALQRGLNDPSAARALYCLEMLTETNEDLIGLALVSLLDHPNADVRKEALKRMERLKERRQLSKAVTNSFEQDPVLNVRGQALRTMAHLIEADNIEEVATYLDSENDELRLGSMVGLIRGGGIAGILVAGNRLMENTKSDNPNDRILAANVLGEVGIKEFYQPLVALINDPATEVQKASLRAAKNLRSPKTVPAIIDCCDAPLLRTEAIAALISIGKPSVAYIDAKLGNGCETSTQSRLIYALGRIPGSDSLDSLSNYLSNGKLHLRRPVASAILSHGDQIQPGLLNKIREWIEEEGCQIAKCLMISQALQKLKGSEMVVRALHQDMDRRRESLVYFLALIYPRKVILKTRAQIAQRSAEKRALAIEMLDNVLTGRHKQIFLPLIDTDDRSVQNAKLRSLFNLKPSSHIEHLHEILTSDEWTECIWLKCAVLHMTGNKLYFELSDIVSGMQDHENRHLQQMANWTLLQLDKPVDQAILNSEKLTGKKMLTPVERVIFLKGVSIFSQLPDAELLDLSDRLREITLGPNSPIIVEGDLGTSMFVVVSGGVRVHSNDVTIVELGEGAVFGELAALDPEARSASVTTTMDTLLFTLGDDALSDLMNEHPAVARGIIKVLCQRLRETTAKKKAS